MGQTDMKALGEAIAVLDAQEDGGATLLTEDARRYYGQVVSLVTVRGDRVLNYGRFMEVMGELNRAGLTSISLVTNSSVSAP